MVTKLKEEGREIIASKVGNATNAEVVTPSDSSNLPNSGSLYIGGAGSVAVVLLDGTETVIFKNVNDGQELSPVVKKVLSTGTNATDILVLY